MGISKRRYVVQRHHLDFQPGLKFKEKKGEIVRIYQSEHWVITQLQRRTLISKGLLKSLRYWIEQVENDPTIELIDLEVDTTTH